MQICPAGATRLGRVTTRAESEMLPGMRAAVFDKPGTQGGTLSLSELPSEPLPPGHVRVRMRLAPIHPSDRLYIAGTYGKAPERWPAVPGFEGVGTVVEARGLLGRFLKGRRVCVLAAGSGTWAEEVVVPARRVIPIPAGLSDEQAATFFINPATALALARHVHRLRAGEWVVQTAANSQVGRMVIRLGKAAGFRTINLVRRPEQIDPLRSLGGDVCLVHDPETADPESLRSQIEAQVGKAPLRAAIDPVGGPLGSTVFSLLGEGGLFVAYGSLDSRPLAIPSRSLIAGDRRVEGFWLGPWMERKSLPAKIALIRELRRFHQQGVFETQVTATHPLADVQTTLQQAERSGGKILLDLR